MRATTSGHPGALAVASPALFVGRRAELADIAASSQRLRLVLIYGVGGVGKTSLMLRAAEELARQSAGNVIYHVCRAGESLATIAAAACRQLATRRGPARAADDPLETITRLAARTPLVLCLDDAHRAGGQGLLDALVRLARRRLPLWIMVASRQVLGVEAEADEHLDVRLGGLGPADTQALWLALERLYGPAAVSLQAVARRSAGNPLLVKAAFAGPLGAPEAETVALGDLPTPAAAVLAQACAFRLPVSAAALATGGGPGSLGPALDLLERRFLVERRGPEVVAVHDLVREAVMASTWAPSAREHARCLAHYRQARGRARQDVELELLHHALAAGEDDLVLALLEEQASYARRLLPLGAVAEREVAEAIDAITRHRQLPVTIQLLRCRIRARQGDARGAYDDARALADGGEPLADLDVGEMAYSLGDPAVAIRYLKRAAATDRLGASARVWAAVLLVDAYRASGAIAAAHRQLRAAGRLFTGAGPVGQALRCWLQANLAHDAEDYRTAAAKVRACRRWLARARSHALQVPLLASLERIFAAECARPVADPGEAGEFFEDTLFFRLAARLYRAEELYLRGEVRAVAALAEESIDASTRAGYDAHAAWGLAFWGEAQRTLGHLASVEARLLLGVQAEDSAGLPRASARTQAILARVRLAEGRLDSARALALAAGRRLVRAPGTRAKLRGTAALAEAAAGRTRSALRRVRTCGSAQGFDRGEWQLARVEVLLWAGHLEAASREARLVCTEALAAGWKWLGCQARVLAAEALFRRGDLDGATATQEAAQRQADVEGYAAERLRAVLLGAGLASVRGDRAEAERLATAAAAGADEQGFGLEAEAASVALASLAGVPAAAESPGARLARRYGLHEPAALEVQDAAGVRWLTRQHLAELDAGRYERFIDLARGRVLACGRWTNVAGQRNLTRALDVLARRPGAFVPTADFVREVWGVEHHPVRHQSRVRVTMTRLRRLLGAGVIAGGRGGYRLVLGDSWAVARPRAAP
ncbi:MAG TPA: AAA family ATPase [Polyangia bacterium]|jgi:hypothetical protein